MYVLKQLLTHVSELRNFLMSRRLQFNGNYKEHWRLMWFIDLNTHGIKSLLIFSRSKSKKNKNIFYSFHIFYNVYSSRQLIAAKSMIKSQEALRKKLFWSRCMRRKEDINGLQLARRKNWASIHTFVRWCGKFLSPVLVINIQAGGKRYGKKKK